MSQNSIELSSFPNDARVQGSAREWGALEGADLLVQRVY